MTPATSRHAQDERRAFAAIDRRRARRWRPLLVAVALLGLVLMSGAAEGHEIDSASLSLREVAHGRFLVRWHASSITMQEQPAAAAVFPEPCRLDGAYLDCGPSGLVGAIAFPWLEGTLTRVMVDIEWSDGSRVLRIATPSAPSFNVYDIPASTGLRSIKPVVVDYVRLGIEHILTGFDHLLFVVALALMVRRGKALVAAITAFTVAHSLTLASTVLGLVSVPSAPVEATIALSIVLVCAECLRPADSLARRAPWVVAFAFGLLHGLGFASALLEIGLPENHVPVALLCFNVGVEIGQLAVIGLAIGLSMLAARLRWEKPWLARATVYAMGGVAAFWSIDRVAAVFGL